MCQAGIHIAQTVRLAALTARNDALIFFQQF